MSISRVTRCVQSPSKRELALERRVFHRDDALWYSENNDDPGSPMTVERLPFPTRRNVSNFLRSKRKLNEVSHEGVDERSDSETEQLFFIDKTPSVNDRLQKRRCENLNESVILLDSPKPSSAKLVPEADIVDLCSESEDEQPIPPKKVKEKEKKTELSKVVEEPKNDSLDVIVLDDDEESAGSSLSKSSKGSNGTKLKPKQLSKEKTSITSRSKTDTVRDIPKSRANYRSDDKTSSKDKLYTTGTCSSSSNAFDLPTGVNSNKNAAITLSSSTKLSCSADNNDSLPQTVRRDNRLNVIGKQLLEKPMNNSRNALAVMDPRTFDLSNNVGSNIFNPNGNVEQRGLRPIIIDGCNVAIAHGGNRRFSVRGLCICVEYFLRRGHTEVFALVPLHQRAKVSFHDRGVLDSLQSDKHLVFTPSRYIDNRLIASYDDRYIVQYAAAVGGVVVSKDNYRDLLDENPAWRDTILNRLLIPTWVGDMLMFPVDPMGKRGPNLDEFLRFPKK